MSPRPLLFVLALGLLSGCASAPVQFYTIAPTASDITLAPRNAPVTYVPPVSMPDYLDTQDILVRDGSRLVRSSNGRWASRLSQSATDLIVARLSQDWPQRMVTAYPPLDTPESRLGITIERMDLLQQGQATLIASWTELPRDENSPPRQGRASVSVQGSVTDDAAKAALLQKLFEQLADKIAASLATR
ncbi:PqiC family protein [Asaia spathodeae]|uniref:Membrane integrity-associated transporter subunit PqiC n=1 Tax=Asaia spathodeae TaxID=657016 RepID=A0ABX2P053_9PROT|nr:PqiC family protein [Asaia spathodeae]GBR15185.1 outer membrane lipoprotein [Asaia spathodeae NBRC 105894]